MSAYIDLELKPKARRLEDAARMMGVSRPLLSKLAREGKIKLQHIGRRVIIIETEIDRILKEGIPENDKP